MSKVAPETVATYDQLASMYAARWADSADRLAADRRRFIRMVPAGALVLDLGCGPGRDLARFRLDQCPSRPDYRARPFRWDAR